MESTFNKVGNKVIEKIEEKQRAYEDKLIEEAASRGQDAGSCAGVLDQSHADGDRGGNRQEQI